MTILFEKETGEKILIGQALSKQEVWRIIHQYLQQIGFKSYYQRVMPIPDEHRIWIDFGSHVCFMHVIDVSDEQIKEFCTYNEGENK